MEKVKKNGNGKKKFLTLYSCAPFCGFYAVLVFLIQFQSLAVFLAFRRLQLFLQGCDVCLQRRDMVSCWPEI